MPSYYNGLEFTEMCEFMKKYQANPTDVTLLGQYTEILTKQTEMTKKFEEWDKGTLILEMGTLLQNAEYDIKVLNLINFKKSMHYNRATCSPLKRRRTALFQSVL